MYISINEAARGITAFSATMPQIDASFGFCQDLLDRTRQAVFSYDVASSQFTYLNPAFETVFQRTRESATTPASLLEMVHSEDLPYLKEKHRELLEGAILKDVEFRIELLDYTERWVCLTLSW